MHLLPEQQAGVGLRSGEDGRFFYWSRRWERQDCLSRVPGLLREGRKPERGGLSSGAHQSSQVQWWEWCSSSSSSGSGSGSGSGGGRSGGVRFGLLVDHGSESPPAAFSAEPEGKRHGLFNQDRHPRTGYRESIARWGRRKKIIYSKQQLLSGRLHTACLDWNSCVNVNCLHSLSLSLSVSLELEVWCLGFFFRQGCM